MITAIRQQRKTVGTSKVHLLHDVSSAHKAKVAVTFLKEQNVKILAHSPYSPDLAPWDGWLFLLVKEKLAGRKFSRIQDLGNTAVNSELHALCPLDDQNAFEPWRRRLELCVRSGKEYFEGM